MASSMYAKNLKADRLHAIFVLNDKNSKLLSCPPYVQKHNKLQELVVPWYVRKYSEL